MLQQAFPTPHIDGSGSVGVPQMPRTANPVMSAPLRVQPQAPTGWGPASFARNLQMLAMQNLTPSVHQALDAIAKCERRIDLLITLKNLSPEAFSGLMELVCYFNKDAAGELAVYAAISHIEMNEPFPEQHLQSVLDALPLVKALPDDVAFTLMLAKQTSHQSPPLQEAMQTLFNTLMHGPRK